MRITSSGNVGIGTTNPEELLELSSSNTTGGQLLMESTGSATDSYAGMRFKIAGGSDGGYEKAGIFAIRGSGGFNDLSLIFATNTAADATNVTSANERMRITGAGNVGIGTTSPSEKLDISGTGDVKAIVQTTSSGSGANTALGVKTAADGNWLIQTGNAISSGLRFYDVTNSAERMRITSGGDVLIGLTSGARLSVRDAGGNDTHFGLGANYDNYITAGSSGVTIFRNATTERMRITSSGEILVNTTTDAGAYYLQVNGDVYATAYYESSDRRLKDILLVREGSYGINTVTFKWKDQRDSLTHVGYLAQDVEKVLPDAVKTNPNGYKTVNYDEVQSFKIAALEQEVAELKEIIKKLIK
jgi:hypothetical protein